MRRKNVGGGGRQMEERSRKPSPTAAADSQCCQERPRKTTPPGSRLPDRVVDPTGCGELCGRAHESSRCARAAPIEAQTGPPGTATWKCLLQRHGLTSALTGCPRPSELGGIIHRMTIDGPFTLGVSSQTKCTYKILLRHRNDERAGVCESSNVVSKVVLH
jgi:hypothetical protein